MAFRMLENSKESEIHIKDGQLEATNKNGFSIRAKAGISLAFKEGTALC